MPKTTSSSVQPCRVCGSVTFNPDCVECVEVKQQSMLFGVYDEADAVVAR